MGLHFLTAWLTRLLLQLQLTRTCDEIYVSQRAARPLTLVADAPGNQELDLIIDVSYKIRAVNLHDSHPVLVPTETIMLMLQTSHVYVFARVTGVFSCRLSQREIWERALFLKAAAPGANFRTVIQRHPRVRTARQIGYRIAVKRTDTTAVEFFRSWAIPPNTGATRSSRDQVVACVQATTPDLHG